jgi:hypothetical protein
MRSRSHSFDSKYLSRWTRGRSAGGPRLKTPRSPSWVRASVQTTPTFYKMASKNRMTLVSHAYLKAQGIVDNLVNLAQLAQIIDCLDFPRPLQIDENRLAWRMEKVEAWLLSQPSPWRAPEATLARRGG